MPNTTNKFPRKSDFVFFFLIHALTCIDVLVDPFVKLGFEYTYLNKYILVVVVRGQLQE